MGLYVILSLYQHPALLMILTLLKKFQNCYNKLLYFVFHQIPKYKLHKNATFANNSYCRLKAKRSFNFYMKATGIVRRIDACVIIGQKPINRITTGFFNDFCPNFF